MLHPAAGVSEPTPHAHRPWGAPRQPSAHFRGVTRAEDTQNRLRCHMYPITPMTTPKAAPGSAKRPRKRKLNRRIGSYGCFRAVLVQRRSARARPSPGDAALPAPLTRAWAQHVPRPARVRVAAEAGRRGARVNDGRTATACWCVPRAPRRACCAAFRRALADTRRHGGKLRAAARPERVNLRCGVFRGR